MENFSDEQFERLLEGLSQPSDIEPFEGFLNNLNTIPDIAPFNSFCDPTLVSLSHEDPQGIFCFPPLPAIEEETTHCGEMSPVPPLDDQSSVHSIVTPAPERNEALEVAHWVKLLVDMQQAKQDAMKQE